MVYLLVFVYPARETGVEFSHIFVGRGGGGSGDLAYVLYFHATSHGRRFDAPGIFLEKQLNSSSLLSNVIILHSLRVYKGNGASYQIRRA